MSTERKFNIGDKVYCGDENQSVTIIGITDDSYTTDSVVGPILFSDEDNWALVNSIEYVLKDAFIERAGELLARMIWEVTYKDLEGDSTHHYDKTEFIEDFKTYLKRE